MQTQDVTAYEDMIRKLETELVSAKEDRRQVAMDFRNLQSQTVSELVFAGNIFSSAR